MRRHCIQGIAIRSITLLWVMAACSRATTASPAIADQQVTLASGEAAIIAGASVRVVAIQDSRCPSDVVCITAGDVFMIFAFSGSGEARTDTLRLMATPKASTYGGLVFQPTTVLPYPDTRANGTTKAVTLHVITAP
jgi:hypothetical protein